MGDVARLLGLALLGFGPGFALFFVVVARRSQLVLASLIAAFSELVALMLASLLFEACGRPNAEDSLGLVAVVIFAAVLFQEGIRYAYLRAYDMGETRVKVLTDESDNESPFSDFATAVSAGLGFGLMYSLIMYGGVLQASLEPGDLFSDACPHVSSFIVSALLALMYQVLHICLTVLMLDALRQNPPFVHAKLAIVFALHLAMALLSLINASADAGGCTAGVSLQAVVLLVAIVGVASVTRKSSYGKKLR